MTAAVVLQGDARDLVLPDDSVDLIITSPPYWSLRSYTDGGEHYEGQIGSEESPKAFIAALVDCTREWMRVLKPTGSLFVNLGDKYAGAGGYNNAAISRRNLPGQSPRSSDRKQYVQRGPGRYRQETGGIPKKSLMGLPWRYALECIDTLGLVLRAELIWNKPTAMPESVKDRVRRSHEQWFHFVQQGSYFADVDPIRLPHAAKSLTVKTTPSKPTNTETAGGRRNRWLSDNGGRKLDARGVVPTSVWSITSEPFRAPVELGVEHFAAFPSEWPKRLIQAWSPEGGVVLDPFGGTGTTALAAQELGRVGISVDLSSDYCRLAQWRTSDPEQVAKMRKRIGVLVAS